MNEADAAEFERACTEAFGFLVTDRGFRAPVLEIDHEIHFATVAFVGQHVAVECIYDERERWVEVKVARVVNGVRPNDYAVDGSGRRVRAHLYPLLIERGVRDFKSPADAPSRKPLYEMLRARLLHDAELLKRRGADIVGDSPTAL